MSANTWRVDVEFRKETHVAQGHLDPLLVMRRDSDGMVGNDVASVEIQALISGPFSDTRIVSTVRLACLQTTEAVGVAQEQATELAMEGLRNGWEILQDRVTKGHFPGCAGERPGR
jgi:hypothetical protein